MLFRMLLCGLMAALFVGWANALAQHHFNWNITNLMWLFLPMGAALLGAGAGMAAGIATNVQADRGKELTSLILSGLAVGFVTVAVFYYAEYAMFISVNPDLSNVAFVDYLAARFRHFSLSAGGPTAAFGEFGLVVGGSDFLGGPLGGIGGALIGASWRRQRAGVKAIPSTAEDVAAVLSEVACVDGYIHSEEIRTAIAMLMAHSDEHYQCKEGETDAELRRFAESLTAKKFEVARVAPINLDHHLAILARGSALSKRIVLRASAYVALCDEDLHPSEYEIVCRIGEFLGFSRHDIEGEIASAHTHLISMRQASPCNLPSDVNEN